MESSRIRINLGNSCYTIVSCSVIGEGKIENQDSMKLYHDENQIIIVVADGLGSAIYSKEGSQKITSLAVEILAKRNDLSEIAVDLQSEWKEELSGNLNLYDTTVKFIKITETDVRWSGGRMDCIQYRRRLCGYDIVQLILKSDGHYIIF